MRKRRVSRDGAAALRNRAEKRLRKGARPRTGTLGPELGRLGHELEVHRIELEMQNAELRRSQTELEASRARYSELFHLAPVGYFTLDDQALIVESNLAAGVLLGTEARFLVGKPFQVFIEKESRDGFGAFLRRVRRDPGTLEFEGRALCKGHGVFDVLFSATSGGGGKQTGGTLLSMIDISGRKRAEEESRRAMAELQASRDGLEAQVAERTRQLRRLNQRLVNVERLERRRLAQMLHDNLQQLLFGAKLNLSALREREGDPAALETLDSAIGSLDQAVAVSRSLTSELRPAVLPEKNLLSALEWLARQMESRFGLKIEFEVGASLEGVEADARIVVFEVVQELLFNVAKHAKVKAVRVEVAGVPDGRVKVVVLDKGAGFDKALRPSAASQEQGFGLLSIEERLGEIGGRFDLRSSPGTGTRAELTVPTRGPAASGGAAPEAGRKAGESRAAGPGRKKGEKIRVLVADDHRIVREGLRALLGREPDIEVIAEAANGRQAVEAAIREKPDVVLMDVTMPEMDGIEATLRISSRCPGIGIIGLSMHEEEAEGEAMLTAGARSYLTKGEDHRILLSAIRECAGAAASEDAS